MVAVMFFMQGNRAPSVCVVWIFRLEIADRIVTFEYLRDFCRRLVRKYIFVGISWAGLICLQLSNACEEVRRIIEPCPNSRLSNDNAHQEKDLGHYMSLYVYTYGSLQLSSVYLGIQNISKSFFCFDCGFGFCDHHGRMMVFVGQHLGTFLRNSMLSTSISKGCTWAWQILLSWRRSGIEMSCF